MVSFVNESAVISDFAPCEVEVVSFAKTFLHKTTMNKTCWYMHFPNGSCVLALWLCNLKVASDPLISFSPSCANLPP